MDKVKISIIMPIYNCEDYLEECLDSVIRQTLRPIEIICVDDGSTDHSYEILQDYEEKYNFIHVYAQENRGAGIARNYGLTKAKGEFIAFLDADDFYMDVDALEKMYNACKQNKVGVCGSCGKILEGNTYREANFYDASELREGAVYNYRDFQWDCGYCNFIFARRVIEENNIRFQDYRRFQDPPFMVRVMYYAKQFVMADTRLGCYRAPDLIKRFDQAKAIDLLKGLEDNLNFAKEYQLDILFEETLKHIETTYLYLILHNLQSVACEKNNSILIQLMRINVLIQDYYKDNKYLLRSLQMLMTNTASYLSNYEAMLDTKIDKLDKIGVYGAGRYAKNFLRYLKEKNYLGKVERVIVSELNGNEEQIQGIKVTDVCSFMNENKGECIFVAVGAMYHQEIAEMLEQKQYFNYELLDDAFLGKI